MLAFAGISVGGLWLTRPALMRMAGTDTPAVATGVDAMQGRIGVVTSRSASSTPAWSRSAARRGPPAATSTHEPIPEGTRVEVVEIKGVTALVIAGTVRTRGDLPEGERDGSR